MARGHRQRRFPLEPLLELTGQPSQVALAKRLDVHVRQVVRWSQDGGMTARHADMAACAIGLHPALVWPVEWAIELAVIGPEVLA